MQNTLTKNKLFFISRPTPLGAEILAAENEVITDVKPLNTSGSEYEVSCVVPSASTKTPKLKKTSSEQSTY
jgi:hypothetical protein